MSKNNYEVIDQMFAAVLSANESEATIKALRPQVEEAVQALMREQGKPKGWTGTLHHNGIDIVVSRPTSYTWEKNNNIQDPNLDYYKQQHALYEQLSSDIQDLRAEMKLTGDKLAKAHPESDSIKVGFRLAFKRHGK